MSYKKQPVIPIKTKPLRRPPSADPSCVIRLSELRALYPMLSSNYTSGMLEDGERRAAAITWNNLCDRMYQVMKTVEQPRDK